jgi:hypothetical protein
MGGKGEAAPAAALGSAEDGVSGDTMKIGQEVKDDDRILDCRA